MIKISEHHGFKDDHFNELDKMQCSVLGEKSYRKTFQRGRDRQLCFSIKHHQKNKYKIESSYMIGVDWVIPNQQSIYVEPKLNTEEKEVDYLTMLFEALQEPENFKHLDDLYTIDFKAPLIEIKQQQDKLTPLLLLEFLQLLRQIVRKGLKKSYYKVTENLNSRVKGKLLIATTVKINHSKNKMLNNVCQFEEFGYNSVENKVLKKALLFTQSVLNNLKGHSTVDLKQIIHYVSPAFEQVNGNIELKTLKNSKPNPLFKEYTHALKLAKLILKKYGYNISKTTENKRYTPPFWIDMSKLFELYVLKKLKEVFTNKGEVLYHERFNGLEPDYLLKSTDGRFKIVIDAKYKPHYENNNISHNDSKQVSGYCRLKSIRKVLHIDSHTHEIVNALIIYTNNETLNEDIKKDALLEQEDNRYVGIYKYAIQLPLVK